MMASTSYSSFPIYDYGWYGLDFLWGKPRLGATYGLNLETWNTVWIFMGPVATPTCSDGSHPFHYPERSTPHFSELPG